MRINLSREASGTDLGLTRSDFKIGKNGSLTLLKEHRSGHRLRLVYTMANDGVGGIYV
jgi:hypothetical protein